ncbi:hypothetical protein [Massilia sp. METH4]|uniref:hypothetical protein n=1 Tax=Massilia sp. METH4 TaxID=3123041 RepID=UPI0030D56307
MSRSTFSHHFGPHQTWGVIILGGITLAGGSIIALESMGEQAAWMCFQAGVAWLSAGVVGMRILGTWARRRAFAYALYAALAWGLVAVTLPISMLGPLFLWPSIGSLVGLVLLEYFIISLAYQSWTTWRFFNAQWSVRYEATLARCFDPGTSMLAPKTLIRRLGEHDSLFLPYWPKRAVAAVTLLLIAAMVLAFALYGFFFESALLVGGIVSVTCITYLLQHSVASLLLVFKVLELERSHGAHIALMDDAGVERLRAAERRAKRRNKR